MKIKELSKLCLGGYHNTVSVERPINKSTPNEIIYTGKSFELSLLPKEIGELEFTWFSVNSAKNDLRADIVIYIA